MRFSWEIDGWEPPEDHGDPLDPHDTLADPERHAHLTPPDRRERDDREADAILSDFGARPVVVEHVVGGIAHRFVHACPGSGCAVHAWMRTRYQKRWERD